MKKKHYAEKKKEHDDVHDASKGVKRIVPDTSVIINGILSGLVEKGELKGVEIIIPEFVVEELRAQASRGREIGFDGLEEIKKLRTAITKAKLVITKDERRQTYEEIQLAKYGRIDALIIDIAKKTDAVLYTADRVQAMAAEAEGLAVRYFEPYEKEKTMALEKYITDDTMSVHLKEGTLAYAKRGKPGNFKLVKVSEALLTEEELEAMSREIMEAVHYEKDGFLESSGHGATVVQLRDMRIAIARPPFSDGMEITLVRPIIKLALEDYKLSDKLKKRIETAEGVLIAGPPGSGKSTFVASVAEFYESKGRIVKTMESPRDLQVKPEITQYAPLAGDFAKTADILLLVRPDYTIFDEVRKTRDFQVFADMRLSGIGMVGVVHATTPIDAIQRFVGRVELGMIPHVLDTIIYIKAGCIEKVYSVSLVVRSPTGMNDEDLARPLVEVRDFETNELEYEIYTYGEENVVVPIKQGDKKENAMQNLAKKQIYKTISRFDEKADISFLTPNRALVKVDNTVIPRLIGKDGKQIQQLEKELGISIEVAPKAATLGKLIEFEWDETGAYLVFSFDKHASGKSVNFYASDEYLFSAVAGRSGQIRVNKHSDLGKKLLSALLKKQIKVFV